MDTNKEEIPVKVDDEIYGPIAMEDWFLTLKVGN